MISTEKHLNFRYIWRNWWFPFSVDFRQRYLKALLSKMKEKLFCVTNSWINHLKRSELCKYIHIDNCTWIRIHHRTNKQITLYMFFLKFISITNICSFIQCSQYINSWDNSWLLNRISSIMTFYNQIKFFLFDSYITYWRSSTSI